MRKGKTIMLNLNQIRTDGEYLLVNTDDWFLAKDGNNYKAVWGKCKIVEAKDIFGFKPTNGTNWYLQVGDGENAIFIAGCRIHYAQICLQRPMAKDAYHVG